MRDTVFGLSDSEYLRLDGENVMTGPLLLPGDPTQDNHAASKGYLDRTALSVAQRIALAQAAITLASADASAAARVAAEAAIRAAADALLLPIDGSVAMTGDLTLPGAPTLALHAATKAYVDALPPNTLDTYDAVVAAAGGDYTSVATACATEAAGARIFIKSGTYNEGGDVTLKDSQMLIGEHPEDTIIDFGGGAFNIVSAGNMNTVRDLTVQNSIDNTAFIVLAGTHCRVMNCRLLGTGAAYEGVHITGNYGVLANNYISGFARAVQYCAVLGSYNSCYGNVFRASARGVETANSCSVQGNVFDTLANEQLILNDDSIAVGNWLRGGSGIVISGPDCVLSANNLLMGAGHVTWDHLTHHTVITGNEFDACGVNCTQAGVTGVSVTGNDFDGGIGVYSRGLNWVISGNTFQGTAFIELHADCRRFCITGNNFGASAAAVKIIDPGATNIAKNNGGVPTIMEKAYSRMTNTSGGDLVAGDVVVLNAVAAGDEVTTTAAQGDDLVFGMLDEAIVNNAEGYIQTEGKTTKLKVNGTVAIAIGDLLGTLNAAQIAMKAAAGDMAFAIALEVYAGADSLGVIDALLIKPRKV